jgi:hypothetical protein
LQKGECAVKYLRWGERNRSIVIYSPDSTGYQAIVRRLDEIQLIGRVIWAWREFK